MKKIPTEEEKIDLTKARHERCEPIVAMILKAMLDKDLLFNDRVYLEKRVLETLQVLYQGIAIEHFNEIFETLDNSMVYSLELAQRKLWGRDKGEITLKDIEKVLKEKRGLQNPSE